jgi:hypothetical protein
VSDKFIRQLRFYFIWIEGYIREVLQIVRDDNVNLFSNSDLQDRSS